MADFGFHNTTNNDSFDLNNTEIKSFSDLQNKDGSYDVQEEQEDRQKRVLDNIENKLIKVTDYKVRQSKKDDGEYITLKFEDEDGNKCFYNTGSKTVRSQLENKQINGPFYCKVVKKYNKAGNKQYICLE